MCEVKTHGSPKQGAYDAAELKESGGSCMLHVLTLRLKAAHRWPNYTQLPNVSPDLTLLMGKAAKGAVLGLQRRHSIPSQSLILMHGRPDA